MKQQPTPAGSQDLGRSKIKTQGAVGTDQDVKAIRSSTQSVVGGRVAFGQGGATMTAADQKDLDQVAEQVRGHRNIVLVKGHTALDDLGEDATPGQKLNLSLQRAQAVADRLVADGVSPDVLRVVGVLDVRAGRGRPVHARRAGRQPPGRGAGDADARDRHRRPGGDGGGPVMAHSPVAGTCCRRYSSADQSGVAAMTSIEPGTCPHCGAGAAFPGAEFCSACGMALPSAAATGPRVGRRPQPVRRHRRRAEAAGATSCWSRPSGPPVSLLSVGLVNLAFAAFYAYLISQQPRAAARAIRNCPVRQHGRCRREFTSGCTSGPTSTRSRPRSPGWSCTCSSGASTSASVTCYRPAAGTTSGATSNYYFFRILMVIYLIRGIAAAVRHRTLLRQQAAGPAPLPVLAAD